MAKGTDGVYQIPGSLNLAPGMRLGVILGVKLTIGGKKNSCATKKNVTGFYTEDEPQIAENLRK